jgi:hypothetical protein
MLRELPVKMAQAISAYLGAPNGCVDLYQPMIDQMGQRTWNLCGDNNYLQADYDGIYEFSIGIRMDNLSILLSIHRRRIRRQVH